MWGDSDGVVPLADCLDQLKHDFPKAPIVVLHAGHALLLEYPSDILQHACAWFGSASPPGPVAFVENLPGSKAASGMIMHMPVSSVVWMAPGGAAPVMVSGVSPAGVPQSTPPGGFPSQGRSPAQLVSRVQDDGAPVLVHGGHGSAPAAMGAAGVVHGGGGSGAPLLVHGGHGSAPGGLSVGGMPISGVSGCSPAHGGAGHPGGGVVFLQHQPGPLGAAPVSVAPPAGA
mmetsp:Transcript_43098/g.97102  ORF Transcript_43098/g.97102 Transcript_43098/m.97102 type:complete len:229 (-) Transcript_43098:48-734(-)